MQPQPFILGAGMTGLAAGIASGLPVFEAAVTPGGICSSYYVRPNQPQRLDTAPADGEAYQFENGGGHWIFGGDPTVLHFIQSLTPVSTYHRRSSVYFAVQDLYVPFPIQNHLSHLGPEIAARILTEIVTAPKTTPRTMADSFRHYFGPTLTERFFGPFHELYTAGLWTRLAPQDDFKSPVNMALAVQGAFGQGLTAGYNVTFVYPPAGLNTLARRMAQRADVRFGCRAVQVDVNRRAVIFADGSSRQYSALISTLPLNHMLELAGLTLDEAPDPHTSVLVLNIGAVKGPKCPADHWLYNPDATAGFHRVGFYSNVDPFFLPQSARMANDRVSVYVERAYPGGQEPSTQAIKIYAEAVVAELQQWQFIGAAEVVDPTWIEVAYTWAWPGSTWKAKALRRLQEHGIYQVGRYGRWQFQGIADSIRDGFFVGAGFKQAAD